MPVEIFELSSVFRSGLWKSLWSEEPELVAVAERQGVRHEPVMDAGVLARRREHLEHTPALQLVDRGLRGPF